MQIIDSAKWDSYIVANSQDGYGRGILDFAMRWADLLELDIAESPNTPPAEVIAANAPTRERHADTQGITGFMYGAAVQTLTEVWAYGKELQRWHNGQYLTPEQADDAQEKGQVVNPALLTISG